MKTAASEALRELLRPKRPMSQTELARELDVSPQAVSEWVSGNSQPTPDRMGKIEDLLGIPMRLWTKPKQQNETSCSEDECHPHDRQE